MFFLKMFESNKGSGVNEGYVLMIMKILRNRTDFKRGDLSACDCVLEGSGGFEGKIRCGFMSSFVSSYGEAMGGETRGGEGRCGLRSLRMWYDLRVLKI